MADEKNNIFVEQGISGLTRFSGIVYEEWLKELQGQRGAKVYREMRDNDAVIGAFLYAIEMLIRKVIWKLEVSGKSPEEIEATKFIETCLDDMCISWNDTVSEILTFLPYGWCFMELCYKKRMGPNTPGMHNSKYSDGKVGWRKWGIRSQETLSKWLFTDDGSVLGMEQLAPPDYKFRTIPMEKALLFRTRSNKENPEGRSILRNAYRSWYFKKNIEEVEAIGIERDLAGFPIMWVPPEILAQETDDAKIAYAKYKQIITNIKRDEQEGLLLPLIYDDKGNKVYDIEMLSAGSTRRQFDTNLTIQRYEQRIAMTVMADFILIGHEKTGSYALSANKSTLFQSALETILQCICDVVNKDAIPKLLKLNGYDVQKVSPKLIHDEVEKADLEALGNFINKVVTAGAVQVHGDTELENFIRQKAKMPKRPDDLEPDELLVDHKIDDMSGRESDRAMFLEALEELKNSMKKEGVSNENKNA